MTLLNVAGIVKQQEGSLVLKDISFTQQSFQKIAIAGETGSGKSTLLKIIAGLIQPDKGEVWLEEVRVKGPEEKLIPGHPGIAFLSQQFELRNNYRVEEVLQYANKLHEVEADTIYEVCRIKHLLKRKTDQVSGGEKQRIAIARLLTSSPKLLLLDEPYSNLDMIHKNILKAVIHDIGEKLKITCTLISHDPLDTLSWADEIIVMKEGKIIQKGSPVQVYKQPVNEYTAALFGKYNLLSPTLSKEFSVLQGVELDGKNTFIRPENFKIVTEAGQAIKGKVNNVIYLGSTYEIEVLLAEEMVTIKTGLCNILKGDTVYVSPISW
jgi:ABC-type Fe3+/spermidine/putrescine transport system ATPase subunit